MSKARHLLLLVCLFYGLIIWETSIAQNCPVSFSFTPNETSTLCAPVSIKFTAQPAQNGKTIYTWDFGDGESSMEVNPTHVFNSIGEGNQTFQVKLSLEDTAKKCLSSSVVPITIKQRPEVKLIDEFGATISQFDNCKDASTNPVISIKFIDASRINAQSNYTYHVTWGDGAPTYQATTPPSGHTYSVLGVYSIAYTVTGPNGCSSTRQFNVYNVSNPKIGLGTPGNTIGCGPLTLTFPINEFEGNHESTTYTIDPGDGTTPTQFNHPPPITFTHTYTQSSCPVQEFIFSVTAYNGCTPSIATVKPIKVFTPPQASFDIQQDTACVSQNVNFTNTTQEGFNNTCSNNTRYEWDFGDGTPLVTVFDKRTMSHAYAKAGAYTIQLKAINSCNPSIFTQSIVICEGVPVSRFLAGPSNIPSSSDCTNSEEVLLPNSGCLSGTFVVALTDNTMANGSCSNQYSWEVINRPPGALFSNNKSTSEKNSENLTVSAPGVYIIRQRVSNACGTSESCVRIVAKAPPSKPVITDLDADYCPGNPVKLNTTTMGNIDSYDWAIIGLNDTPNPDLSTIDLTKPDLAPISNLVSGTYQVKLTVTNACGANSTTANFTIAAPPNVQITPNGTVQLCPSTDVVLKATTGLDNYQWLRNGTPISGATMPELRVNSAGKYSVQITAGCTNTSQEVEVKLVSVPAVDAGPDKKVCVQTPPFALTASVPGGAWTGKGVSSNGQFNPQAASIGENRLYYSLKDSTSGCSSLDSLLVTIEALPTVKAGNDTTFCIANTPVRLTGFSPIGGQWSGVGVVDASGSFNPQTAGGEGTYTLYYSYATSDNCQNTDSLQVRVIKPEPVQAGADLEVCQNGGVLTLLGQPAGGQWRGPGIIPGTDRFDPMSLTAGDYIITYERGVGTCLTADEKKLTVKAVPLLELGAPLEICAEDATFSLKDRTPASGGVGSWSGKGISPEGMFDPSSVSPGVDSLVYTFTDLQTQCSTSDTLLVTVYPLPQPSFRAETVYCVRELISFDNATPAVTGYTPSFVWEFGDGIQSTSENGQHTYANAGTFEVKLTVRLSPGNCQRSFTKTVQIAEPPKVAFSKTVDPINGCGPLMVGLKNPSTGVGNLSYQWDFGNGQQSTDVEPSVTFQPSLVRDTLYVITLTVSQPGLAGSCSSASLTDTVVVKPSPQAGFIFVGDYNPVCSGYPMLLDNFSIGNPVGYEWDFGDGTPRHQTTDTSIIQHVFTYNGNTDTTYIVTLKAFNDCGENTFQRAIQVVPKSVRANIQLDQDSVGCAPHTVHLVSNQSGLSHLDWDFGDGNRVAYGPTAIDHTYERPGEYYIKLTVQNGCSSDADSIRVRVNQRPVALFDTEKNTVCQGEAVRLQNTSTAGLTSVWGFGDNTFFTGANPPLKTYRLPGQYTITLTVTNPGNGCRDTLSQSVTVIPLPEAGFTVPFNVCQGDTVLFRNTSTGAKEYRWDFGDPDDNITAINPGHAFTHTGNFQVKLIAYNEFGCRDSVSRQVTVLPSPQPDFDLSPLSGTTPVTVHFENRTTNPPASQGTFDWNFDNGEAYRGFSKMPDQKYENKTDSTLLFTVTLKVTNSVGCVKFIQKTITIQPTPCAERIRMPNAFTPNGDNLNDAFRPVLVAYKTYLMQIFTRWGQEIFRSEDPEKGWDGKRNDGKLFSEDMYVYKIVYTCRPSELQTVTGDFLLIHKD